MNSGHQCPPGLSGKLLILIFLLSILSAKAQVDTALERNVVDFLAKEAKGYELLGQATSSIGHRLTGTENGKAAEDFVYHQLKSLGVQDVQFEPFPVTLWKRQKCKLEVVPYKSDDFQSFEVVSLANTPSFSGSLPIVDGGDGLEADLKKIGAGVKGKCLLINLGLTKTDSGRYNLHRAEKVALAIRYGAAAVLMAHPKEADILLTGTASLTGKIVSIPAVCLSGNDAKELRSRMKKFNILANLSVENTTLQSEARNVVARFPGALPANETIVFCGHLDSWDLSAGALDNGIGSFTLLDVARAMQHLSGKLNRNVEIVWFMGEEEGLLGSKFRVENLKKKGTLQGIRAVVNLDMAGNPIGFNSFGWPGAKKWFSDNTSHFPQLVSTFKVKNEDAAGLHSDHQSFMLEGVPVFSPQSQMPDSVYTCYHANCDNFNLVQPEWMLTSAQIHALLAVRLANSPRLPFTQMGTRKLTKWLRKAGLKEKLEISGEWKWK